MGPLAAVRVPLLAAVVLLAASACSPAVRSVQLVADPQDGTHRARGAPETVGPEALAPDDRLAILRVGYANPLEFPHALQVFQLSSTPKPGNLITSLHLTLDGTSGDRLLLLRFKADTGDAARLYPYACVSAQALACNASGLRDSHLYVKLPPPGEAAYLGRILYRVEDIYPHRGTRNHPQVRGLAVRDAYDEDTAAARQRWPVLNGRPIARSPGHIRS